MKYKANLTPSHSELKGNNFLNEDRLHESNLRNIQL